jgi:hypothetical protein
MERLGRSPLDGRGRHQGGRHQEVRQAIWVDLVRRGPPGAAEERLAESAVAEEIHVLFEVDEVLSEAMEDFTDLGAEVGRHHHGKVGLTEVTQAVRFGLLDELMKVDGFVGFFEVFVEEVGIGALSQQVQFLLQQVMVAGVLLAD